MIITLSDFAIGRRSVKPVARGRRRRAHPESSEAFTLVEILVTMTVTVLLVFVLLKIFNDVSNTWRRSEVQVDAFREARGALQFMARDLSATLQASYVRTDGTATGATAKVLTPTLVLQHSPDIKPAPDPTGPVNEEVYCLTNVPNAGSSSLCAIGYFCQWMPDFVPKSSDGQDRVPRAFALMRQSLDSNQTFLRIKSANVGSSPLSFENLFSQVGPPAATITQIAAYVWDLRFRIDTDLNDTTTPDGNAADAPKDHSPNSPAYPGGPVGPFYYAGNPIQPYPPRLPAYVEIRFRALSDLAARRLEGNTGVTPSTWNDGPSATPQTPYTQIIKPNYQQFVLRVQLINANPLPTPTPGP